MIETAERELGEASRANDARPDWTPLPGPQTQALETEATVIGFGGQAGGGKTGLLVGCSLTRHRKAIIFRREYVELREVVDQAQALLAGAGDPGRFNANDLIWRFKDGRTLELGAVKDPDDWQKFRGRPHDFIGIDEATEFLELQVRGLIGWLRTVHKDQRCRVVLTFNPPTNENGRWVVRFFAPWLDPEYPNPALPGEVRWFAMIDGEEKEVPSGEPFEHDKADGSTERIQPLSRTFIPARLAENPYLMDTGYEAVLQSMPEPLRSQLLRGDFGAGMETDPWQVIPAEWVRAANRRWHEMGGASAVLSTPLTIAGIDVAHGGADATVLARRHDDAFAPIHSWPGVATPTGMAAAQVLAATLPAGAVSNVDAIGYGASCAERLRDPPPAGFGLKARPVNVAERSEYRDRSGRFRMLNLRAEMYWRLREALDPDLDGTLALPPDAELLSDLTAPRFEITTTGIKIESKPDIKARLGRSPDKGDAVALAMLPGPRMIAAPVTAAPRTQPRGLSRL